MSEDQASEGGGSLRRRALQTSILLAFETGGAQIIRLVGNLILTRILVPEAFGLISLVMVLMTGVTMLTDIGIRDSVIRASREDADFLNTAWTVRIIHAVAIFTMVSLAAIPYARFYDQPLLAQLIPVAGFQIVLLSLQSTKEFELARQMLVKRLVPLEIASQIFSLVSTIALSLWLRSVWALVWGLHVGAAFRAILTHTMLPGVSNRLRFEAETRHELIRYGRWVVVSSALTFAGNSLDRLVMGKLVPVDVLGIYGIAKTLAEAPRQIIEKIGYRVVFPLYRSILEKGEELAPALERARRPLLVSAGYLLAGVSACAQPLVDILYDSRYTTAGSMLQIIPLGIWFSAINSTNLAAFRALGQPRVLAMASLAQVLCMAIGLVPATKAYGIHGGITVLTAAMCVASITSTALLAMNKLTRWWSAIPWTLLMFGAAGLGVYVESLVDWHPLLRILLAGGVVTLCWSMPLLQQLRELQRRRKASRQPAAVAQGVAE